MTSIANEIKSVVQSRPRIQRVSKGQATPRKTPRDDFHSTIDSLRGVIAELNNMKPVELDPDIQLAVAEQPQELIAPLFDDISFS